MPGGDRRGPFGAGPMTGRGAGYCGGYDRPGWANPVGGRLGLGRGGGWGRGAGFGWGHGGGFGWGRGFGRGRGAWAWGGGWSPWAPAAPVDEREALEREAQAMERGLEAIRRRLNELEGEDKSD